MDIDFEGATFGTHMGPMRVTPLPPLLRKLPPLNYSRRKLWVDLSPLFSPIQHRRGGMDGMVTPPSLLSGGEGGWDGEGKLPSPSSFTQDAEEWGAGGSDKGHSKKMAGFPHPNSPLLGFPSPSKWNCGVRTRICDMEKYCQRR